MLALYKTFKYFFTIIDARNEWEGGILMCKKII